MGVSAAKHVMCLNVDPSSRSVAGKVDVDSGLSLLEDRVYENSVAQHIGVIGGKRLDVFGESQPKRSHRRHTRQLIFIEEFIHKGKVCVTQTDHYK